MSGHTLLANTEIASFRQTSFQFNCYPKPSFYHEHKLMSGINYHSLAAWLYLLLYLIIINNNNQNPLSVTTLVTMAAS